MNLFCDECVCVCVFVFVCVCVCVCVSAHVQVCEHAHALSEVSLKHLFIHRCTTGWEKDHNKNNI